MFKKALAIAALTATAGSVFAEETLTCKRTSYDLTAFKSAEAASSWFPEKFRIHFEDGEAFSDDYRKGTVEQEGKRKKFSFILADVKGNKTVVRILYIEKNGRYSASLESPGYGGQALRARGRCVLS